VCKNGNPSRDESLQISAPAALSADFAVGTSVATLGIDDNWIAPKKTRSLLRRFSRDDLPPYGNTAFSIPKPCDLIRSRAKCFLDSQGKGGEKR
jgi:hypothetical protein